MTIEINNVGPIERIEIPIPEEGGVVVLRGANGCGKSTAIEAVGRLTRGSDAKLTPRHGHRKGSIEGFGATIQVGLKRIVGEKALGVVSFDKRINIADLVDPGIKDPESADRRRILTACHLAGVESDPEKWRALAPGLDHELSVGDLITQAKGVRAELHRRARAHEDEAIRLEEKARVLQAEVAEVESFDFTVEAAQAALEEAIREEAEVKQRRQHELETKERGEKARIWLEGLGKAPDVQRLDKRATRAEDRLQKLVEHRTELEEKLEQTKRLIADAEAEDTLCKSELEAAQRLDSHRAAAVSALEEATRAADDGPSLQEVEAATEVVAQARKDIALAAAAARADEKRAAAKAALEERVAVRDQADAARSAADRVDDVLAEHLAAVMPQGLRVIDSRLMLEKDGRMVPFAELSEGERWAIAIDIAIGVLAENAVIPIEQAAWEGLDGNARREIAEHARRRGITVLAAEADHGDVGPLRAEVAGG